MSESTEAAFLKNYNPEAFDRPSVAVDVALLSAFDGALHALFSQRKDHPYCGDWALPGGFVGIDESIEDAVSRVLRVKAGLQDVYVEQLYTFGAPSRDPRMRIITVAHYALVPPATFEQAKAAIDAVAVARLGVTWAGEIGGPIDVLDPAGLPLKIAFDHSEILQLVVKRLRGKLDYSPVGYALLPAAFTLRALQEVHETIRGQRVNKDSFRRRLLAGGLIETTGEREHSTRHRPAALYRFRHGPAESGSFSG